MSIAQELKIIADKVRYDRDNQACIAIVKYVKLQSKNLAADGKTELVCALANRGWTNDQAILAKKELIKEGFKCKIGNYNDTYIYQLNLHVSWA
jgi:hypothetical protein